MKHVPNVVINLSFWCNPAAEVCFTAYIHNAICTNLLGFNVINGSPLSGGPHYSRVKMRTRWPRPKTKHRNPKESPQLHYKPCQRSVWGVVCVYTCVSHPTFWKVLPNTDPCKVISPPRTSLLCVLMATSQTLSSSLPGLPTTHTNTLCLMYTHTHTHTHTHKQHTTWLP